MVELDVPAMIHVSGSCNPGLHATGAFYIAADTIAFMQLIEGDLFADFPTLRFIIPHGGGAVPYHWGRYRGLADMLKKPDLAGPVMNNEIGRASCRQRVCQSVYISVVAGHLKKKK